MKTGMSNMSEQTSDTIKDSILDIAPALCHVASDFPAEVWFSSLFVINFTKKVTSFISPMKHTAFCSCGMFHHEGL